jgi:hypothetical protein
MSPFGIGKIVLGPAQPGLGIIVLIHGEISPPQPCALRSALDNINEAVLFLSAQIVEELRFTQIALEELVAHRCSTRQLEDGAITSFMAEDEPAWMVFPRNDKGLLRIHVGMRRTGNQRSGVVPGCVIIHFCNCDHFLRLAAQLSHRHRQRLLK